MEKEISTLIDNKDNMNESIAKLEQTILTLTKKVNAEESKDAVVKEINQLKLQLEELKETFIRSSNMKRIIAKEKTGASEINEESFGLEDKKNTNSSSSKEMASQNIASNNSSIGVKKTTDNVKSYVAKNAMVGKEYKLALTELGISDIVIDEIVPIGNYNLEEIGLTYAKDDSLISGFPVKNGEFNFKLVYTFSEPIHSDRPEKMENRRLRILIIPNPKSLWTEKEPPKDSIYPKSHYHFDRALFLDAKIFGASLRGRSHAHNGTHRDDHFIISQLNEKAMFLAVADGAGSAKYSREGSKIACVVCYSSIAANLKKNFEELVEALNFIQINGQNEEKNELANNLIYQLLGEAVRDSRNAIIEKSNLADHELRDYSTTLLFTVILKIHSGFCLLTYGIGDGIIAIKDKESIHLLTKPDGGEFAGQTRFLTMSDAISTLPERLSLKFVDSLTNLFLMTDGISDPFFDTDSDFKRAECWDLLINELYGKIDFDSKEVNAQFEEWIGFFSKGNHDDRTLILIK